MKGATVALELDTNVPVLANDWDPMIYRDACVTVKEDDGGRESGGPTTALAASEQGSGGSTSVPAASEGARLDPETVRPHG